MTKMTKALLRLLWCIHKRTPIHKYTCR